MRVRRNRRCGQHLFAGALFRNAAWDVWPGFPVDQDTPNQYFTVQDRRSLGRELFNEQRFRIKRSTAPTSTIDTHSGLFISLVPNRAFGSRDIGGMSSRFPNQYEVG
jgi:hypothetical protein